MDRQTINWYPGHMTKTKRDIEACIKNVDGVVEILDARLPLSSANPDMKKLAAGKPRLIVLNKADLAEESRTRQWTDYFRQQGHTVISVNSKSGAANSFIPAVETMLAGKIEKYAAKGMKTQLRLMVCGIPNVGKSSFINRLAGGRKAKVEDRPGVTRGRQWITVNDHIELLDTPGILWPKLDDPDVAERLAFTGAVKDNVMDISSLAMRLCEFMCKIRPDVLTERYQVEVTPESTPLELLGNIAKRRGMLVSGGEPDIERCAIMFLDELRGGKLGRITFEQPRTNTKR